MNLMNRDDLSTKLIHFTKGTGETIEEKILSAKENLRSILKQKCLIGGRGFIKGNFQCICFSEAPITKFTQILEHPHFAYAPVGVMIDKAWLFKKGGRPVIYQTYDEYANLPNSHKYRIKLIIHLKLILHGKESGVYVQIN